MSERKQFRDLAPPAEARETIASLPIEPGTETVSLREARGRVLIERIDASLDVPGFDRASMDGYAVRAVETFGADETDPATLRLAGTVHAGEQPDLTVEPGEAVEVSTGAVLPDGADAVVMVERTDRQPPDHVQIRTGVAPGDNVMFAGADVAAGDRTLGPGTLLTSREVGLLSALGVEEVPVRRRPRVGVISTGDELVRPGDTLDSRAGKIYDVNSYSIATAIEEAGGIADLYPHVDDDPADLRRVLREAAQACDLVLSSGSTSASTVDVIYRIIDEEGDLLLHGVAVKPGKPMLVGRLAGTAYIGLPGYPVSALTIFRTFVAPALRAAAERPEPRTAIVDGEMAVRERYGEGRQRLLPVGLVTAGEQTLVYPVDKGSGATTSLVEADGIVSVPAATAYLAAGERVSVQLFSPDIRPPAVLAVGEDDPALSRLLDRVDRPRFLSVGTREGLRRLDAGIPDAAVATGPDEPTVDAAPLGGWSREWGLLVPAGNPAGVAGLADLIEQDLRFVTRTRASGMRASFDAALADLAGSRDEPVADLKGAIDGYDRGVRAHESPGRRVTAGMADVGLGLRPTAVGLDLEFVPLGTERVRILGNPARTTDRGLQSLTAAIDQADAVLAELPGYKD